MQSKNSREEIEIPSEYHPFVGGANGSNVAGIMDRTGVKINMPPHNSKKSGISIVGEKEGVAKAKEELMKLYTNAVSGLVLFSIIDFVHGSKPALNTNRNTNVRVK